MVVKDDDWRIDLLNTCKHLKGVGLRFKAWRAPRPGWDHDHCSVCTAKIRDKADLAQGEYPDGYATCADFKRGADHDWVCVECFHDFKDRMGWYETT